MAQGQIDTIKTIGFEGTGIDGNIVWAKTLKLMRSEYLGIGMSATAMNPQEIQGGTAIFSTPEMVQSGAYVFEDRNDNPDLISASTKEILLSENRTIKYELETFDRMIVESSTEGQLEAEIASGIGLALMAELDADFIAMGINQAIENGEGADTGYIINANYSTGRTQADVDTMFYDTVDMVGNLEGTVDKSIIGVNKAEVVCLTNTKAGARFIKAGNGGDKNESARLTGNIPVINGIALAQHPMVGKKIDAGTSFAKDKAYDFTKLEALIFHGEAMAEIFAGRSLTATVGENSGNPKFIFKYKKGEGVIRPKLVRAIFNADPTATPAKTVKKTVKKTEEAK